MRLIKNFNEFINESKSGYSSYLLLPDPLKKFFNKNISGNIFSKVIGSSYFDIGLDDNGLYFIINGGRIDIPFIKYDGRDIVFDREELENIDNYQKICDAVGIELYREKYPREPEGKYLNHYVGDIMKHLKGIPAYGDLGSSIGTFIGLIIRQTYDKNTKSEKKNLLNPFDTNLDENPIIKNLKTLGVSIVSSERQKKNGTIQFRSENLPYDITVNSGGYIRRLSSTPAPITKNIELSRPIQTQDDLDLKLTYVFIYCIKSIMKNLGIESSIVNKVAKSFYDGDILTYDSTIRKIAEENPRIAYLLPDPNNAMDPTLVKGSAILSRFI